MIKFRELDLALVISAVKRDIQRREKEIAQVKDRTNFYYLEHQQGHKNYLGNLANELIKLRDAEHLLVTELVQNRAPVFNIKYKQA